MILEIFMPACFGTSSMVLCRFVVLESCSYSVSLLLNVLDFFLLRLININLVWMNKEDVVP